MLRVVGRVDRLRYIEFNMANLRVQSGSAPVLLHAPFCQQPLAVFQNTTQHSTARQLENWWGLVVITEFWVIGIKVTTNQLIIMRFNWCNKNDIWSGMKTDCFILKITKNVSGVISR